MLTLQISYVFSLDLFLRKCLRLYHGCFLLWPKGRLPFVLWLLKSSLIAPGIVNQAHACHDLGS